jgi:HK97 family phage prohead protease
MDVAGSTVTVTARPDLAIRAGSPPRHHARAERYAEIRRETRAGGLIELRAAANGDHEFEGLASTFGAGYVVEDWLGEYTEEFAFGAFTRTLAENDVPLLIEHEGLPLARTSSGTLTLSEIEAGLRTQATLLHTDPDVMRIAPKMARGDLTQMSIAFRVVPGGQSWNDDMDYRRITEAALYDVSIVTSPANPNTSAALRSLDVLRRFAALDPGELAVEARSHRGLLSAAGEVLAVAQRDATVVVVQVDDDDAEDDQCGACGADMPAGAAFCPSCGTAVSDSTVTPALDAAASMGAALMSASGPRDTASTMHVDIARRQIELQKQRGTRR